MANVSNTVGLVPGSASGAFGYRKELAGQRARIAGLGFASVLGGVTGAVLLLVLPASAFKTIVSAFIIIALALIVAQPRLSAAITRGGPGGRRHRAISAVGVYVSGVYGGYFGAAQGIMLLAILGLARDDELQRINALKVVLAGLVNLVAAIVFVLAAHVAAAPAALIAARSIGGGVLGSRYGRRLSPTVLRLVIVGVGVGVAAIVQLQT